MVTNQELSKIFEQFAEIISLQSGDNFRIIAYEKAAQTIKSYGESLQSIYERGGTKELEKVPGIGESIADKIEEYIKTGKVKDLEKLKKGSPSPELEFIKIPGVGPKTAVKLYKKLQAKNIKELKTKLATKGRRYFKEKSLKNILRGIDILSRLGGRMLLAEAMPIAERIVGYLKNLPAVKQAIAVGSIRRWKETVGDIDIIATAKQPKKVIDNFVKFPEFKQIISQGDTKSTLVHESGLQVDLEILPENEFGSLLQHFTGSKEHNVALRTYAVEHGFSISEHGIKITKGKGKGKLIRCAKEEDVYRTLKMDSIEPELREDRGEIQAALKHKLPKLVELGDIKGDLHVHSNWSDGRSTIEQIMQKAHQLHYDYVAISDHTVGLGVARGLSVERFRKREHEIAKARKKFSKIKVFSSCEVNIKPDGSLDMPDKIMKTFDVVTASIHWSFNLSKEEMTKRMIRAIKNPFVDIIGHPSGRLINRRESYQVDWQPVFKTAAQEQVALEISAFPDRLDLTDGLVFEARKFGVRFVICTDSHALEHFDLMRFGVSVARRGWCERRDILNTLSYKQISKWLSQN